HERELRSLAYRVSRDRPSSDGDDAVLLPPSICSRVEGDKSTEGHRAPKAPCSGLRGRMAEGRGPQPLGGEGGLQVGNSGNDFKPNPRHNSGEEDTGDPSTTGKCGLRDHNFLGSRSAGPVNCIGWLETVPRMSPKEFSKFSSETPRSYFAL